MIQPISSPVPSLTSPQLEGIERLRVRFSRLPDTRMAGRILHRLEDVLVIAFISMLADNDACTDMEAFARSQLTWLRTFLPLKNGAPSHDVFRNVLIALKPQSLLDILAEWCGELSGTHIRIDGKTLRGSDSPAAGQGHVHILRAWVHEAGISAGHALCGEKTNELATLPQLLDALQLKGATVSIDAMGCDGEIAAKIHDAGADYLLALKGNQKGTLEAVSAHFKQLDAAMEAPGATLPATHQRSESVLRSHGRYEERICTVTSDLDWYHKSWKWAGLQTVVRLERRTHRGGPREALTREVIYYLSTLPADAAALAALARAHWAVENGCHHVLDVTFGEDHCQVRDRNAAHNLSILRELTGRTLRRHLPKKSIRSKRKLAAMDPAFRLELVASTFHNSHA
jgi:predicted transposase YbfD/YdcC